MSNSFSKQHQGELSKMILTSYIAVIRGMGRYFQLIRTKSGAIESI